MTEETIIPKSENNAIGEGAKKVLESLIEETATEANEAQSLPTGTAFEEELRAAEEEVIQTQAVPGSEGEQANTQQPSEAAQPKKRGRGRPKGSGKKKKKIKTESTNPESGEDEKEPEPEPKETKDKIVMLFNALPIPALGMKIFKGDKERVKKCLFTQAQHDEILSCKPEEMNFLQGKSRFNYWCTMLLYGLLNFFFGNDFFDIEKKSEPKTEDVKAEVVS